MAGIDVNRTTSGVTLPAEVSAEIWANMQEASAVQSLARRVELPGTGTTFNGITADATAAWVAETDEKPVSRPTFSPKTLTPYTLAVIVPFSNQFRRDASALYSACVERLPLALAKTFDETVFAASGAPGSNFAQIGTTTNSQGLTPHATNAKAGTYAGLVAAYSDIADEGGVLDGWALSPAAKALLLAQVDASGRPLLLESIQSGSSIPTLLGEVAQYTRAALPTNTLGYAGDWSSAVWGSVEGVSISISEGAITDGTTDLVVGEETVQVPNQVNLWQRNMFAVRAEIEIGFQVADVEKFVKLTDATRSA